MSDEVKFVYRIQDADGRGPWKPGVSQLWTEDKTAEEYERLKPIFEEFPDLRERLRGCRFHIGVACESLNALRLWITRSEWKALKRLGYRCYRIRQDKIIARSDVQCVFESEKPLASHRKIVQLY